MNYKIRKLAKIDRHEEFGAADVKSKLKINLLSLDSTIPSNPENPISQSDLNMLLRSAVEKS